MNENIVKGTPLIIIREGNGFPPEDRGKIVLYEGEMKEFSPTQVIKRNPSSNYKHVVKLLTNYQYEISSYIRPETKYLRLVGCNIDSVFGNTKPYLREATSKETDTVIFTGGDFSSFRTEEIKKPLIKINKYI